MKQVSKSADAHTIPKPRHLYPPRHHWRWHIQTLMSRNIQQLLDLHSPDGNGIVAVDFGCGKMPYRQLFDPHVSEYLGADLPDNPDAAVEINSDGIVNLPDDSAEIVISSQVLEHVEKPDAYLSECLRLLKPGGILILSTHGMWRYHPHPNDLWRWTGEGLRRIVSDAKFELVEFRGLMGLGATAMHLFQDAAYVRIFRWLRPAFFFCMQNVVWLADKLHNEKQRCDEACVFVLVARKGVDKCHS